MGRKIRVKPGKGQSAIGFFGGLVFCFIGMFIAIPTFGLFGIFWTLIAVVITVANGLNAFTDRAIVSHEIIINDDHEQSWGDDYAGETVEHRLQKLQKLYDQGLISSDEYRQKRQKIIDSI